MSLTEEPLRGERPLRAQTVLDAELLWLEPAVAGVCGTRPQGSLPAALYPKNPINYKVVLALVAASLIAAPPGRLAAAPAVAAGAAVRVAPNLAPSRPPPQLPAGVLAVPVVRQQRPYSCGPAALAAILRYLADWDGREDHLYRPLGTTPEDGTLPEKLAEVARSFGLRATMEQRMSIAQLRLALGRGQLVILELQAWISPGGPAIPWSSRWDDGHYVVLVGMDRHYAYFMDPSTADAYTYLALDELGPRWHDINQSRPVKDPALYRDYQVGVVIGPATAAKKRQLAPPPSRLIQLD